MKDLFFKNITSEDRRQRKLISTELMEQQGIRSCIHRHLVCRIVDIGSPQEALPAPTLYVVKKQDTKLRIECFYCRIKGQMYLAADQKIYLISFIHSLKIELKVIPRDATNAL